MFFTLSKILAFLLTPFFWVILIFAWSLFTKKAVRAKRLRIIAFVFLIVFSNSFFVDTIVRLWETPYQHIQNGKTFKAGVVLGGGMVVYDFQQNRIIFKENTDRFLQALTLYKQGKINKIILSGGSGSLVYKNILEGALIHKYFIDIGIPSSDLLVDSLSNNTYENAKFCSKIINDSLQGEEVLLITSALHMKRSAACFKKQNIIFSTYPTNKIAGQKRKDVGYYIIPDADSFSKWEKVLHEIIGYFVYLIMGYL